ncbi:MAG: PD-(D/E)XK nuclease family protein [Flavobacteriaceae bacterium]
MTSFIAEVVQELKNQKENFSELTFVLPNKRAGIFLKQELSKHFTQASFLPEICSIESFIEELSQLKKVSSIELLFEFYGVYKALTPKEKLESFDQFSKWAPIVLQDFNEIDRYLVPPSKIFDYLGAVQKINHWSLDPNPTKMVKGYLYFWQQIKHYYTSLVNQLLNKGVGYQGLMYRTAVNNLEDYIQNTTRGQHIFLGFNALNSSESTIVQELLQQNQAQIYWDIDQSFLDAHFHDAGHFMRHYKKDWPFFKSHAFNWATKHYQDEKNINVIGAPKNISQVKYIGELLDDLHHNNALENTALVLGDESLLLPILNTIPKAVEHINITMGLPLRQIPFASFIEQWFQLQMASSHSFYHKDVVALLTHPFVAPLFKGHSTVLNTVFNMIKDQNRTALTIDQLTALAPSLKSKFALLFGSWNDQPKKALKQIKTLIFELKTAYDTQKMNTILPLEYLLRFLELFNQVEHLDQSYAYINSVKTLHSLYIELLSKETLDFKGEPLKGLQIMGMLESRVLDFKTVILVSVNEGILPAGKTQNSFIPFDVKLENGLPTYKEKDAIYTYHFYRLLQRAHNVYLVYNTEPDVLNGGEPSRFIAQMQLENCHQLKHKMVAPKISIQKASAAKVIKTPDLLDALKSIAKEGFSPSSLGQYIRNPIDFYNYKVLGLKQPNDIEETIEANTFGSVVHYTLEAFYEPFVGETLEVLKLEQLKHKVPETVEYFFKKLFKKGDITQGKNLISFEIAKRYINNFLDAEIQFLNKGNTVQLLAVEESVVLDFDHPDFDFPIKLKGNVDRIDVCNGVRRIIDYKTSKVSQTDLNLVDWTTITQDYKKHSKSFQLLMYAYILNQTDPFNGPTEAGIFSFKNFKSGVIKFTKKDKPGNNASKQQEISEEILESYKIQLVALLSELFNPNIEFIEKEV